MNTGTDTHPRLAGRGTQTQVLLAAGIREAWRLIRHPVHIAGWLYFTLLAWASVPYGTQCRYGPKCFVWFPDQSTAILAHDIVLTTSVPTFAAASLLATRPRRKGSAEWLSSLPTGSETRWAVSVVAALGPFLISLLVAGMSWCYMWTAYPEFAPGLPSLYEHAVAPVAILGAALLPVLLARCFPWPLSPTVIMFSVVQAIRQITYNGHTWASWFTPFPDVFPPESAQGSMPWHLTYLLGFDLLIVAGVFLAGRHWTRAAAGAIPVLALVALAARQQFG
jgi:hypothetical protein